MIATPNASPTTETAQAYYDLGLWLSAPDSHTDRQLYTLLDEELRLPCIALANQYWLVGALTHRLQRSNVWALLDDTLRNYLEELAAFYLHRSQSIKAETRYVCQLLIDRGIDVTILKGAAHLFNGVADSLSTRFMLDIDLLVTEADFQRSQHILEMNGFESDAEKFAINAVNHHHAPALYRQGGPCCIEVHRRLLIHPANQVLTTSEALKHREVLPLEQGLAAWQMKPTEQLIMSIAHAELSHACFVNQSIDLQQLANTVSIGRYYEEHIDWREVWNHFSRAEQLNALRAHLYAAKTLLRFSTPLDSSLDDDASCHFQRCLERAERRQKSALRWGHLRTIFRSYSRDQIYLYYGADSHFWLITGRLRHLKRHLLMACELRYWRRLRQKMSKS